MNAKPRPNRERLHAALGDAFQSGWRRLAVDEDGEPRLDLLAAYADCRLSPDEEASVAREIAESPAAFELLASLLDDQDARRRLPSFMDEDDAGAPLRMPAPMPAQRDRRRSHLAAWATAASLLVACGAVLFGVNRDGALNSLRAEVDPLRKQAAAADKLQNQLATAEKRNEQAAGALVVAEKEHVAALNIDDRQPLLMGQSSPDLIRMALLTLGGSSGRGFSSGAVRGAASETNAEVVERADNRLRAAAKELSQAGASGQLEYVAALIQTEQLNEARAALERLEASPNQSRETRGQIENLRASLLATQAESASSEQGASLNEQAKTLFRRAANDGFHDAWLNLAVTLAKQDKDTEAKAALGEYLRSETDPQRQEAVRQALGK